MSGLRHAPADAVGMSSNCTSINRNTVVTLNYDMSPSVKKSEIRARMDLGLAAWGLRVYELGLVTCGLDLCSYSRAPIPPSPVNRVSSGCSSLRSTDPATPRMRIVPTQS